MERSIVRKRDYIHPQLGGDLREIRLVGGYVKSLMLSLEFLRDEEKVRQKKEIYSLLVKIFKKNLKDLDGWGGPRSIVNENDNRKDTIKYISDVIPGREHNLLFSFEINVSKKKINFILFFPIRARFEFDWGHYSRDKAAGASFGELELKKLVDKIAQIADAHFLEPSPLKRIISEKHHKQQD